MPTWHAADVAWAVGAIAFDSFAKVSLHTASLLFSAGQKVRNHRYVESLDGQGERISLVFSVLGLKVRSIGICVLTDLHASFEDAVRGDLGQRAALVVHHEAADEEAGVEALVGVDALDIDDFRDGALYREMQLVGLRMR